MKTIWEMLEKHREEIGEKKTDAARLVFQGVDGFDVYNPTAPFLYQGRKIICARVEKRDSEKSQAVFFEEVQENVYRVIEGWRRYELQDPSIARVKGHYVLGGTEVFPHPENPEWVCWHTTFYYGTDLEHMERLADGPSGMKDVRLVELADKRIGIFTRPQGEKGGRGKIGFTVVDDFSGVTAQVMEDAPLLDLFREEEWGGVNEAFLLADGRVGVLGHIACFQPDEVRHYFPMAFVFDPVTREYTEPKILAERKEFLPGPSKRPDLVDVLFSGGIVRAGEETVLYVGVSDCEVQNIVVSDPFQGV
ncbi:MAG: DUF1861 family protein [Lachnospiraceae bacterium]|nr:DUF1861 family protein [Lachnospiraceae bacterium]